MLDFCFRFFRDDVVVVRVAVIHTKQNKKEVANLSLYIPVCAHTHIYMYIFFLLEVFSYHVRPPLALILSISIQMLFQKWLPDLLARVDT